MVITIFAYADSVMSYELGPTPHTVWHFCAQYGRSAFTESNSVDVLSYTQYTVQDSVGPRPVLRVKVWPRCSVLSTQYTQYTQTVRPPGKKK